MTQFTELPLSAGLQQKLATSQFIIPTPIQAQAIPHALDGKDVIATAQTGTGKTLAFLIPAIERLTKSSPCGVEVLVLVPTRELAMQVLEQHEKLRGNLPKAALVIGGMPERPQIQALRAGARLVVATPGRLEDFLTRKLVQLRTVQLLVLDEADRMLDMGFLPAIRRIVASLPQKRQTLCFSATLEASVAGLVHDYMNNPVRVAVGSTLKPVETVELQAYEVRPGEKLQLLRHLLYEQKGQTLVFARTKRGAERLAKDLMRDGFAAAMIHGDRTQAQRTGALSGFDQGRFKVLVATDVAARGLHIRDVAHVVNYDLPTLAEDFIHRVGRTGRAGARGLASTFVCGAEMLGLRQMEGVLKLRMERKRFDVAGATQPRRAQGNSLPRRSLVAIPGEVFA